MSTMSLFFTMLLSPQIQDAKLQDFGATVQWLREARKTGCELQAKLLIKEGISSEHGTFWDVEGESDAANNLIECMERGGQFQWEQE